LKTCSELGCLDLASNKQDQAQRNSGGFRFGAEYPPRDNSGG
jgi:hypothetical protein